jgi:hypothetical protein
MALPIIPLSKFTTTLPISKDQISYRAFTVKEEKILLLAKEAKVPVDMVTALCQVVDNCTFGKLDLNKLSIIDLEYLFLQIRIKSVSDISELNFICKNVVEQTVGEGEEQRVEKHECNSPIHYELDLTKIRPTEWDPTSRRIKLADTIGIQFRLPTVDDSINIIMDIKKILENADAGFLYSIFEFTWDGDEITPKNEVSQEEFTTFIEGLSKENIEKIKKFVNDLPEIKTVLDITCPKCGKKSKTTLAGIEDFF